MQKWPLVQVPLDYHWERLCCAQGLRPAEAVQETVKKGVQEAEENKNKKLKELLERLNDRGSIKSYVKAHTVPYAGDFNKQMVKRKCEGEERQREMESRMVTNTMLFCLCCSQ